MSIIIPANSAVGGGFDVANSVRFNSGSSDYLSRTPGSAGNQKKFTLSTWIKRSRVGGGSGPEEFLFFGSPGSDTDTRLYFTGDGNSADDRLYFSSATSNSTHTILQTNRKFRDTSSWYNIVISVNTQDGSGSTSTIQMFINGVKETDFASSAYGSQNSLFYWTDNAANAIGRRNDSGNLYYSGYMAETVLVDGQALDATSFGEVDSDSGIWKPKNVSGLSLGTTGYYLDFKDSSALGNDASGSNNFTVNNLTAIDQSTDTCTNNFSTYNPLIVTQSINSTPLFSDGNLKATFNNNSYSLFALSTFAVSSGKWFAEFKMTNISGGSDTYVGVIETEANFSADSSPIDSGTSYRGTGQRVISGSSASYGATYSTGDIIGVALNCDDNEVVFYKNGASQGAVSITADKTYFMWTSDYSSKVIEANFGSPSYAISSGNTDGDGYGNFEYAVPSGYFALNTKNLAEYG